MDFTDEHIERYLEGKLEGEELQRFTTRLTNDTKFAAEVREMKEFSTHLRSFGKRQDLKEKLNVFHEQMEVPGKPKGKLFPFQGYLRAMAVAASVAIMASLGAFIVWNVTMKKEKAHYQELRMDVDKIKQSNRKLWKEIYSEPNPIAPNAFSGTAFAISADGYVITNYHVIKGVDSVFLENDKYHRINAIKVYSNAKMDFALLRIKDPDFTSFVNLPYAFKAEVKGLGYKVFTLGYPREDVVYGEGYISSRTGYDGDTMSYQVSIPVNPGNSGGPLLDEQGNIVGIVSGKHSESEGAAFALKAFYLKKKLEKLRKDKEAIRIKLPSYGNLAYLKRPDQIRRIQQFVFKVGIYN